MTIHLKTLTDFLNDEQFSIEGSEEAIVTNAANLHNSNAKSIIWIKPGKSEIIDIPFKASVIICTAEDAEILSGTNSTRIVVNEPKRIFSKIVNHFFVVTPKAGVHPTAYIHPEAAIGDNCFIGPFSYIGKCSIGSNTIIHGHAFIYDNVTIGNNSIIHAGVVVGSDGFGFSKDENGVIEKFPHIGSVRIGNYVEIGSNTCVDRGALGNTIIRDGAKIDNLVHIAHNVDIGENAFIIANAMIGGSTIIEKGAWIAPSVSLLQQLRIGANATVGVGAVVTKNVPEGETWTGTPARPLQEFMALQKKIKNL